MASILALTMAFAPRYTPIRQRDPAAAVFGALMMVVGIVLTGFRIRVALMTAFPARRHLAKRGVDGFEILVGSAGHGHRLKQVTQFFLRLNRFRR